MKGRYGNPRKSKFPGSLYSYLCQWQPLGCNPASYTLHFRLMHLNSTATIREQGSWIKIPCHQNKPWTATIHCRCWESWDFLRDPLQPSWLVVAKLQRAWLWPPATPCTLHAVVPKARGVVGWAVRMTAAARPAECYLWNYRKTVDTWGGQWISLGENCWRPCQEISRRVAEALLLKCIME